MNGPRARALFEQVLDLPDAEREPFLVATCGGDLVLLDTLHELLTAYELESYDGNRKHEA